MSSALRHFLSVEMEILMNSHKPIDMDLMNLDDFTADTLQYLIENEVEENVHLDYKAGTALQKNDRGKNEITKNISAFANANGGIIIYGLAEKDHKPAELAPFDGNDFSKERLDQIIANIQPSIKGVTIFPIRLDSDVSQSVYVVKIPRSSNAPHMATDHRYYKRNNFQSVAMEDYEVRDLFTRADCPELEIDQCLCICNHNAVDENDDYKYTFYIGISNIGRKVCTLFKFAIIVSICEYGDDFCIYAENNNTSTLSNTLLSEGKVKFTFGTKEGLFPGETIDFNPKFEIPYNNINRFLQSSTFELILWYEGGYKRYKYDLQEKTFEEITN